MGNEIHTPFYEMVQRLKAKKGFSYFPDVGKTPKNVVKTT